MKTRCLNPSEQTNRIHAALARKKTGLAAFGIAGLISAHSLWADVKNLGIEGTITSVSDSSFVLDGSITNGTPFQGYYVFDTSAANSNGDPTVGDYRFSTSAAGIVVKAGNYVFRTNPQHVDFLIELVNRPGSDSYLLRSYNNVCSQPLLVDHIAWQLDDSSGTALADVALPEAPPTLANFTQLVGLTVEGGGCPFGYFIRGEVTSAAPNPAVIPESPAVAIREAVEIQWPSVLGYFYQLEASNDMTNWANVGQAVMGDGTTQSRTIPKGTNAYFRAEIVNYAR
jgi:hypothetical protein